MEIDRAFLEQQIEALRAQRINLAAQLNATEGGINVLEFLLNRLGLEVVDAEQGDLGQEVEKS